MRQSHLFTKTRKEAPKDEVSKNAELLIRGGYIHKEMAGVYDFLPLGFRVFNNIVGIIREEMNAIGGQEMTLSSLQNPEPWKVSGRWEDSVIDVWFKTKNKDDNELGLAPTHEEPLTRLMSEYVASYRDLPRSVYQFQTKFRNEVRAKSGIMRTREFVMKDLYSFSRTEEEFRAFYEVCAAAYLRIFKRVGLGEVTYRTFASGGSFSKFSEEFQTLCDAGEDTIYIDREKGIALNEEVLEDDVLAQLGVSRESLETHKAVEVGNIFPLGTKYSAALGLTFKNEQGEAVPVVMGSYGIGPARLMGTIVEVLSDAKGIVWPEEVAPFRAHVVLLNADDKEVSDFAEGLYTTLTTRKVETLYDDRDARAGEKFADSDLLGIPYRIVVSKKTKEEGKFEVVKRSTGEVMMLPEADLYELFGVDSDDTL